MAYLNTLRRVGLDWHRLEHALMMRCNFGWVLSRLSVGLLEMRHLRCSDQHVAVPSIGPRSSGSISTWIASLPTTTSSQLFLPNWLPQSGS